MTITEQSVFAPNPACPVREIGEGLVIMAADGSMTHSLEDIGAFIWRRLDGSRDLAGVAADMTAEYDVAPETAAADLKAFVSELLAAELVSQVS